MGAKFGLTLTEEDMLRVFENMELRRIFVFEPRGDEVSGGRRKLLFLVGDYYCCAFVVYNRDMTSFCVTVFILNKP
jgi:predicted transcriptional regulator